MDSLRAEAPSGSLLPRDATDSASVDPGRRHRSTEQWARVVASLEAVRERDASVSDAVAAAALLLGVSRSTVWRRLRRGADDQVRQPRSRYVLSDADRTALYLAGGNAAAFARGREGEPSISARTLQRAVAREMSAMERDYISHGWRAARGKGMFQQLPDGHRNAEWQTDHKQLGVTVVLPNGATGKPWITAFVDVATRVVQGWAIDLRPTATTVTCALRRALMLTPFAPGETEPAEHGGAPARLRFDNGREFLARALGDAVAELGIEPLRCHPYQPHRKGRIERWHRTLDQTLLAGLPFYDGGARMADGGLYGDRGSMLTLEQLVGMVAVWIADYHDRTHAGLHGATPRQAWLADATPIREVPAEQLRGLLHRESRRLGKYGIRVDNVWYLPPKLFGARGQVQVRYDKHAPTELLVYVNGVYADTAFPQDTATPEQLERFYEEKRRIVDQLRRDRARATRASRLRIRPMSGAGPVVQTRTLPTALVESATLHPTDSPAARARARTTLRPITPERS